MFWGGKRNVSYSKSWLVPGVIHALGIAICVPLKEIDFDTANYKSGTNVVRKPTETTMDIATDMGV